GLLRRTGAVVRDQDRLRAGGLDRAHEGIEVSARLDEAAAGHGVGLPVESVPRPSFALTVTCNVAVGAWAGRPGAMGSAAAMSAVTAAAAKRRARRGEVQSRSAGMCIRPIAFWRPTCNG